MTPIRISNNAVNTAQLDGRYVLVAGDTMTGKLCIKPESGDDSLYASKRLVIKAGERVYFDGRPE